MKQASAGAAVARPEPPRVPARRRRGGGRASLSSRACRSARPGRPTPEAGVRLLHLHRRRRRPLEFFPDGDRGRSRRRGSRRPARPPASSPHTPTTCCFCRASTGRRRSSRATRTSTGCARRSRPSSRFRTQDVDQGDRRRRRPTRTSPRRCTPGRPRSRSTPATSGTGTRRQRLSFAGPGQLNPVIDNPYNLVPRAHGPAGPDGAMADDRGPPSCCSQSRKSVHDLVRDDLTSLMQHPRLSAADRQRLQQHFDAIRDAENTMTAWPAIVLRPSGARRDDARGAGDVQVRRAPDRRDGAAAHEPGRDGLRVQLPAGRLAAVGRSVRPHRLRRAVERRRQWKFNFISHRVQSDAAVGSDASDPLAAQAHAEIDVVRMQTLAAGLDHFKARGLADQCFVMWTNQLRRRTVAQLRERPPHHLGQRRRLSEAGSVRRRRRHDEQPPAQHADQRRPAGHAHHGGGLRRRPGGMLDVARR